MLEIRIRLESTVCTGSGMGRGGGVDRDVVFSHEGLPYIPGRRLKGLLRDAYEDLVLCGGAPRLPEANILFGEIGQHFAGQMQLDNAMLPDSDTLSSWLRQASSKKAFTSDLVKQRYTEVRWQTAIDRSNGSAKKDSLRSTRVLRAGFEFSAPVTHLPPGLENALALAAAALKSLGTSRTRGLGNVRCRLYKDSNDLTTAAIERLKDGKLEFESVQQRAAPKLSPGTAKSEATISQHPTHLLPLTIKLQQAAIFPSFDGDPNTILTERSIPGSTIQGVLANRYLSANGYEADATFNKLFCTGAVLFLFANSVSSQGQRLSPVPQSVRRLKRNRDRHYDLARQEWPKEDNIDAPLRRADRHCFIAVGDLQASKTRGSSFECVRPDVQLQYHHARTVDNRVGRAIGREQAETYGVTPEKTGNLFTYESLRAEQTFAGALLGAEADLKMIQNLLPGDETVRVGRSKSAQYGGNAKWTWGAILDLSKCGQEADAWKNVRRDDATEKIIVTLLSPMLTRNDRGHPVPELPIEQIAEGLGLNGRVTDLKICKAYTRTEWYGGYLSHQLLPKQQIYALAPGSVFVLGLPEGVEIKTGTMREATQRSYGMHTVEGFGRIAVFARWEADESFSLDAATEPEPPKPITDEGHPAVDLARSIFHEQVKERAVRDAILESEKMDPIQLNAVSRHLLARLATLVERSTLEEFHKQRVEMKKRAQYQLRASRLDEQLEGNKSAESMYGRIADQVTGEWGGLATPEILMAGANKAEIAKMYLLRYFGALSWRKRKPQLIAKAAGDHQ